MPGQMLKQFQLYVKSNMTLVYQFLISIVATHFRQYFFLLQRLGISKSSQLSNGRLSLPGFSCTHQESIVALNPDSTVKPEGRVKIFSGSANLLLAQVFSHLCYSVVVPPNAWLCGLYGFKFSKKYLYSEMINNIQLIYYDWDTKIIIVSKILK